MRLSSLYIVASATVTVIWDVYSLVANALGIFYNVE